VEELIEFKAVPTSNIYDDYKYKRGLRMKSATIDLCAGCSDPSSFKVQRNFFWLTVRMILTNVNQKERPFFNLKVCRETNINQDLTETGVCPGPREGGATNTAQGTGGPD